MVKKRNKFESEVHLGFTLIICVLLLLNFASNYVIHKARLAGRDGLSRHFRTAGLAINRKMQEKSPLALSWTEKADLITRFSLTSIMLAQSRPTDETSLERGQWFSDMVRQLPTDQPPELVEKLLRAEYHELTRGTDGEYFYLYPLTVRDGRDLLILSAKKPRLAYLDNSRKWITRVLPWSLVAVFIVYLVLSRMIFAPFRKIREQAARAGRRVDDADNEAEAVVEEYRRVIERLRRKEAELLELNALIQSKADSLEQLNQYLSSSSSSGIITLDRSGMVLSLNDAARRLLTIGPGDCVGARCERLLSDYPDLVRVLGRALNDHIYERYQELSLECPDSTAIVTGMTIFPIKDNEQQLVGWSLLLNDLTELTRLRSELEKKNRLVALGEMAGGLAHQLRNSMGAIGGYGNLVRRRLAGSDQPLDNIDALLQETVEAEYLIARFLDFARPLTCSPSPVNLNRLLEDIVESFRVREEYRGIDFSLRKQGDQRLEVDATLLKQAISNLIDNGIQSYPDRKGRIRVASLATTDSLLIEIEDFGCGIKDEALEKIFTPFFSLRPSGTGLGLPLASKIVHLHGGHISVSSSLRRGTTFSIHLPRHQAEPSKSSSRETIELL